YRVNLIRKQLNAAGIGEGHTQDHTFKIVHLEYPAHRIKMRPGREALKNEFALCHAEPARESPHAFFPLSIAIQTGASSYAPEQSTVCSALILATNRPTVCSQAMQTK